MWIFKELHTTCEIILANSSVSGKCILAFRNVYNIEWTFPKNQSVASFLGELPLGSFSLQRIESDSHD